MKSADYLTYLHNEISKTRLQKDSFAAKIPQEITNEKYLLECDEEFARFAENPLTQ